MSTQGRVLKIDRFDDDKTKREKDIRELTRHERIEKSRGIKIKILKQISSTLDFKKVSYEDLSGSVWKNKIKEAVINSFENGENKNESASFKEEIANDLLNEITGLGPIEGLLKDDEVNEIMINGRDHIYIERKGKLSLSDKFFSSDEMILSMIDRILAPLGKRVDISSPTVDARLKDGSRVHAIIPPLSLNGPVITIRKFSEKILSVHDLVRLGTLTEELGEFLQAIVGERKNIIVAGGTGSGKTTLLNFLSSFISDDQRIVTIEDSSELKLHQEHTIYLESRPPNIEGKGEVSIRELVRNTLRMRPDRIIVGECRGGEALDMLQAMNTGHEGCMTTLHANSPRDSLARLETMVLMAGFELPIRAIREQISSAIDIIIHLARLPNGRRAVTSVTEVCGTEESVITTQELFTLKRGNDSKFEKIEPTGNIPKFSDSTL